MQGRGRLQHAEQHAKSGHVRVCTSMLLRAYKPCQAKGASGVARTRQECRHVVACITASA